MNRTITRVLPNIAAITAANLPADGPDCLLLGVCSYGNQNGSVLFSVNPEAPVISRSFRCRLAGSSYDDATETPLGVFPTGTSTLLVLEV